MTTIENLEARLNLIGDIAATATTTKNDNITEKGSIKIEYTNETEFILKVRVESKITGDMNDFDADEKNAHWYLNTRWIINHIDGTHTANYDTNITEIGDLEHLGTKLSFGGSNNKQYDHHTWDTLNGFVYFDLLPGEKLTYTAIGVLDDAGGGKYEVTLKEKELKIIIIGARNI